MHLRHVSEFRSTGLIRVDPHYWVRGWGAGLRSAGGGGADALEAKLEANAREFQSLRAQRPVLTTKPAPAREESERPVRGVQESERTPTALVLEPATFEVEERPNWALEEDPDDDDEAKAAAGHSHVNAETFATQRKEPPSAASPLRAAAPERPSPRSQAFRVAAWAAEEEVRRSLFRTDAPRDRLSLWTTGRTPSTGQPPAVCRLSILTNPIIVVGVLLSCSRGDDGLCAHPVQRAAATTDPPLATTMVVALTGEEIAVEVDLGSEVGFQAEEEEDPDDGGTDATFDFDFPEQASGAEAGGNGGPASRLSFHVRRREDDGCMRQATAGEAVGLEPQSVEATV
jgi:hypothetical protein